VKAGNRGLLPPCWVAVDVKTLPTLFTSPPFSHIWPVWSKKLGIWAHIYYQTVWVCQKGWRRLRSSGPVRDRDAHESLPCRFCSHAFQCLIWNQFRHLIELDVRCDFTRPTSNSLRHFCKHGIRAIENHLNFHAH
jgi:hypothetical protein